MSDGIQFDSSGLRNLAADLGVIAAKAIPNVRKAVEVSARNVKDDWRKNAAKVDKGAARRYPSSIDYDLKFEDGQIGAEVGPNLGKAQGSLGFLEEAPGRVANAPQGNARRALAKNVDDFQAGITKAVGSIADA
jgi:hypothetical protein